MKLLPNVTQQVDDRMKIQTPVTSSTLLYSCFCCVCTWLTVTDRMFVSPKIHILKPNPCVMVLGFSEITGYLG